LFNIVVVVVFKFMSQGLTKSGDLGVHFATTGIVRHRKSQWVEALIHYYIGKPK